MSGRARAAAVGAGGERGSAVVEFSFLAVLLMVPLVYVVTTAFAVQGAAYAVASATREAGRAFTTAPDGTDPDARAVAAARLALADHGLDLADAELDLGCSSTPCARPGSTVSVDLTYRVPLPLLPRLFDDVAPATVRVTGSHVAYVDRYRADG